jgi:sialic acid synthase SpsE
MKIDNFEIGKGKTFIIAELSANHRCNADITNKVF